MHRSLGVLIPALIGLAGCGEPPQPGSQATVSPKAAVVTTVSASTEQWPAIYEATGTVRSRSSAIISSKWMAYVRSVRVQAGDRVREGQKLIDLDTRDLDSSVGRAAAVRDEVRSAMPEADSAVAFAGASLTLARTTFQRMKQLYTAKSISDQEYDEAAAKLASAEAAYDMAKAKRKQLDARLSQADQEARAAQITRTYADIESPFAGIVTARPVDPGALAVPGAPLLTLESESYRLEAAVEESKMGALRRGQAAVVTLDGIDRPIDAHVSEIVPAVDSASRAYTLKLDLPAVAGLRSGMFGRAKFELATRRVLAIEATAVRQNGQLQSVFVAEQGFARTRLITLGGKSGGRVEVLSGLSPGERIILPAPAGLADGDKLEVRQ